MLTTRPSIGLLVRVLVIGVSVLLFACGGGTSQPEDASMAQVAAPAATPAQPVTAAQPAPVAPSPSPAVAPAPPESQLQNESAAATVPPPEPKVAAPATPAKRSGHSFTNKDLERYREVKRQFGFDDDVQVVDLTKKGNAAEAEAPKLTEDEIEKQVDELRKQINAVTADLDYLKKRVPSLHNPFLPRVPLTEADNAAEAGMGNDQRLKRVQDRISSDEGQLTDLRRRLADLHNVSPASGSAGKPSP